MNQFKELYSKPCLTPEKSPFSNQVFIRDWPKRCPHCEDIFYSRRLESEYHEPFKVDPEPDLIRATQTPGCRETCGHPQCWNLEQVHQLQRAPYYQKAYDKAFPENHGETEPTGTKRKGEYSQVWK